MQAVPASRPTTRVNHIRRLTERATCLRMPGVTKHLWDRAWWSAGFCIDVPASGKHQTDPRHTMPHALIPLMGAVSRPGHTTRHPLAAGRRAVAWVHRLLPRSRVRRPLVLGLAWCGLWAGSAALWHAFGPPLLLNLTTSVPRGLYVLTPPAPPARGMLVAFPPPAAVAALVVTRGYLAPRTPLLKPVAALPGETVCVQNDGVFIEGDFVAPVTSVDALGRPLPRWRGCVTLGVGEVFPLSTWTPRSFDGRYFGPVPVASLLGRVTPVWTWEVWKMRRGEGERGQDKGCAYNATLPLQNQPLPTRTPGWCTPHPALSFPLQGFATRTHAVPDREGDDAR